MTARHCLCVVISFTSGSSSVLEQYCTGRIVPSRCFCNKTHTSCVLQASVLMVRWLYAHERASAGGFVSRKFSRSSAFFSGAVSAWIYVGSSLRSFLLSGAATCLKFRTKRRNMSHNARKDRSFVWMVGFFSSFNG